MGETGRPLYKEFALFERTVAENQDARRVSGKVLELANEGAKLIVRGHGAMVVGCALEHVYGGPADEILYSGKNLRDPNLVASFAMSPVVKGKPKHGGLGGKFQWVGFERQKADVDANGARQLRLATMLGKTDLPFMVREFALSPHSLTTTTRLFNHKKTESRESLGEFYNLRCKTKDLRQLRVNGEHTHALIGRTAEKQLESGEPIILSEFGDHADIKLPGGRVISLHVHTNNGFRDRLGLILWKNSKHSLAVQPTLGISRSGDKWGIKIERGGHATLRTTLELREAA